MNDPYLGLKLGLFIAEFILLIIPLCMSAKLAKQEEKEFLAQTNSRQKPV